MSGNYEHLTNAQIAEMLLSYNLYATSRGGDIPGPVMLKLIRSRLLATVTTPTPAPVLDDGKNERVLTPIGERVTVPGVALPQLVVTLAGPSVPPEVITHTCNRVRKELASRNLVHLAADVITAILSPETNDAIVSGDRVTLIVNIVPGNDPDYARCKNVCHGVLYGHHWYILSLSES